MFLAVIGNMCTYTNVIINLKKFIELKRICDKFQFEISKYLWRHFYIS